MRAKSTWNKSKLENMQDERKDMEGNDDLKKEIQGQIDAHFFGSPGRKKTRKERKKLRRLERQKMREEEY